MYCCYGKSNRGHGICPLYRGCPLFEESVIRGFTVTIIQGRNYYRGKGGNCLLTFWSRLHLVCSISILSLCPSRGRRSLPHEINSDHFHISILWLGLASPFTERKGLVRRRYLSCFVGMQLIPCGIMLSYTCLRFMLTMGCTHCAHRGEHGYGLCLCTVVVLWPQNLHTCVPQVSGEKNSSRHTRPFPQD